MSRIFLFLKKELIIPSLFFFALCTMGCKKNTAVENKDFYREKDVEVVLSLRPSQGNPRNSEGDFITLKDGRILFIYTRFTGGHDHTPAHLASRISSDSGRTWSAKDKVVVGNSGAMNVMSVSLLRLNNGSIALFYLVKNSMMDCKPVLRLSKDEGKTWSDAISCINDQKGYFVLNNNRAIQLPTGRILIPVSQHRLINGQFDGAGMILCYYSDDDGLTWKASRRVPNPDDIAIQEPGISVTKNGKLIMLMRTYKDVQYQAFSGDNGETWTPANPSKINSPLSPASVSKIPDTGDLLLVWNNNSGLIPGIKDRRTPYNIAISDDDGDNWKHIKTLENDPDGCYCYTAIHYVGRYLLLGYSSGKYSNKTTLSTANILRIKMDYLYKN